MKEAREIIQKCPSEHIITGLESHQIGIPDNPISGAGCACENCIALALTLAEQKGRDRQNEDDAKVADELENNALDICQHENIAQAIRNLRRK
jgi:hypothetical protein